MLEIIRDLFAHQAWADAKTWGFLDATPKAQTEAKVLELLNHIHAVQRFYLSAVQGAQIPREELKKELPLSELRESYQHYHAAAISYLSTMNESHLNDTIVVPWILDFRPKCYEVLLQAVTHSIHHRAQIATLIRQHGGNLTPTDYILWAAKNRPTAQWPANATA